MKDVVNVKLVRKGEYESMGKIVASYPFSTPEEKEIAVAKAIEECTRWYTKTFPIFQQTYDFLVIGKDVSTLYFKLPEEQTDKNL